MRVAEMTTWPWAMSQPKQKSLLSEWKRSNINCFTGIHDTYNLLWQDRDGRNNDVLSFLPYAWNAKLNQTLPIPFYFFPYCTSYCVIIPTKWQKHTITWHWSWLHSTASFSEVEVVFRGNSFHHSATWHPMEHPANQPPLMSFCCYWGKRLTAKMFILDSSLHAYHI